MPAETKLSGPSCARFPAPTATATAPSPSRPLPKPAFSEETTLSVVLSPHDTAPWKKKMVTARVMTAIKIDVASLIFSCAAAASAFLLSCSSADLQTTPKPGVLTSPQNEQ